ncbi:MAG: class I SAM-dependent methyltransferase [Candidatus Aminicenantes bacterium]|nr:class I SAM-dependent methyltransferase [Candidatus Aminicenantes bacterium]
MRAETDSLRPVRVSRRDVFLLFREAGFLMRHYLRIKFRICPILRTEAYVPDKGEIVDLGCGNGLFAAIMKLGSPARSIVGIDLDARKIAAARKSLGNLSHVDFRLGDLAATDYPKADVYTIIDVLYLIPVEAQNRILRMCADALQPGGTLVLKEMDKKPRWKYLWNMIQETISVKIVGFTLGSHFHFRTREDYVETLAGLGFTVEVVPFHRGYGYSHILFLAKKN